MAMFDRIEMDIVDMGLVIALITNLMFPVAALPDAAFTLFETAFRAGLGI